MPRGDGPNKSLFVKNLSEDIRTVDLKHIFGKHGNIADVYIPVDYYTRKPRGFAYVQFEDYRQAKEALYNVNGMKIFGRELQVEFAQGDRKTPSEMRGKEKAPLRSHRGYNGYRPRSRSRSRDRRPRSASHSPHKHSSRRSSSPRQSRHHSRHHHSEHRHHRRSHQDTHAHSRHHSSHRHSSRYEKTKRKHESLENDGSRSRSPSETAKKSSGNNSSDESQRERVDYN